ncbi:hypothetical protein SAMN05446935_4894 [Burkholderia sp. YR290]|nr:hypothetical protein SAMN05446935_4894 [Burkholderia sp. YR290]
MTRNAEGRMKSGLHARPVIDDTPAANEDLPDRFLECTCGQKASETGMPAGIGELASVPAGVKKLDGPLDRARFTLKPVDPKSLSDSRRRATLARFGIDTLLSEQGEADRARCTLEECLRAALQLRTCRGED